MPKSTEWFTTKSLCFFLVVFTLVSGCHRGPKKPEGLPPLFPLTITLTQDGAPLGSAMVLLVPESGSPRWGSGGFSDAQGKAVIKTHGDFPGAPAGKYKVTVMKQESDTNFEGQKPAMEGEVVGYYLVDPLYESEQTTTLLVEVGSGTKEATFDVGKPVRIKVH